MRHHQIPWRCGSQFNGSEGGYQFKDFGQAKVGTIAVQFGPEQAWRGFQKSFRVIVNSEKAPEEPVARCFLDSSCLAGNAGGSRAD